MIQHFLHVPVFSCIYCSVGVSERALFDMHLSVSHRREVVDLSFDCTALCLLNKFLEKSIIQRRVEKSEFTLSAQEKESTFSVLDIHGLLKQLEERGETDANVKNTRSRIKGESAAGTFQIAVKELLVKMQPKRGDKSRDKKSAEKAMANKIAEEDVEQMLTTYFKIKCEPEEEKPALKIVEVYSLSEKESASQTQKELTSKLCTMKPKSSGTDESDDQTIGVGDSELPSATCADKVEEHEVMEKLDKKGTIDVEKAASCNESAEQGGRYNLRHRKKHADTRKDDMESDEEEGSDTPSISISQSPKSATDDASNNELNSPKPIVIMPLGETENPPTSASPASRDLKRSLSPQTSNSEYQIKRTKTVETSPNIIWPLNQKQSASVVGSISTPVGQVAGTLPTVLTTVPQQILQPQSFMLINGQLLPVVSPVMTSNLQQQMVVPQVSPMPLQIQQIRPPAINTQTPTGMTILGNNLQPNLILNKPLGLPTSGINFVQPAANPVQGLPNLIQLQPQATLQPANLIGEPTPLLPTRDQSAQYRLEKNAQGVLSLQPISTLSSQSTIVTPVQRNTVNVQPVRMTGLIKQAGTKVINLGSMVPSTDTTKAEAKKALPDKAGRGPDTDVGLDLKSIPYSSEDNPQCLFVSVYVCGKCHTMRPNRKCIEDHVVMMHFDDNVREASRRRSIAMSKGSYYSHHKLSVLRAGTDWDIPIFRCRHCHLFHVVEDYVKKHIKSDHVMVAGLTEPSRHSLRHPRDLMKIGYSVMSNASNSNLTILGEVQKDTPSWAIKPFLQLNTSTSKEGDQIATCNYLVRMAEYLAGETKKSDGEHVNQQVVKSVRLVNQPLAHRALVTPQPTNIAHIIRAPTTVLQPPLKIGQPQVTSSLNALGLKQKRLKVVGYGCMKCSFRDKSHDVLVAHVVDTHFAVKPYQCIHCEFDTWEVLEMRGHIKETHTPVKPSATEWDFVKRKVSGTGNINVKPLISKYYDTDAFQVNAQKSVTTSKPTVDTNATCVDQVEPDSSCDIEMSSLEEECSSSSESKLADISAPNILSCFQDDEGTHDTNLLPYRHTMVSEDDDCMDDSVNVEGSENTTGDAFACRLCAYSCDTLKRIKSHLMSAHISSDMYPFRCLSCGYRVPSTLRLAQHIQYKHLKTAKKNPPKLARELQNDKKLWPQIVPDQKQYECFQQELDCLFRNCVEKE